VGLFHAKVGIDLQFKNINAGSNQLTITDDIVNKEVDIDVVPENINHQSLSGAGTNTHAQIDAHLVSTSNPHSVTAAQVGAIANTVDTVKDSHIDWGTATGQVSADDIPDGTTKIIPTAVQETNWDNHLSNTSNPHAVTKSQLGLGNVTDDAQLKREAGDIFNSFAEKTAPQTDDVLLIEDSAAGFSKKRLRVSNLPGNANVNFSPSELTDDSYQGDSFTCIAGEPLAQWEFVHLKSDGKWWKAKADTAANCPAQGVAVAAANADAPVTILFRGFFRDDGGVSLPVGGLIYLSPATAGGITGVLPSTTGNQVQILGYALTAQIRIVDMNLMLVEVQ
jgi:hypothetical protein